MENRQDIFDFEIAFCLYKISKILAVFEENKYKSEAYHKAAMAIDAYDLYASTLVAQNKLTEIDGIGESSAKIIKEIVNTGGCTLLSELEKKYKISDYSLILSYGLSNKVLKKLFDYGFTTFDLLLVAIERNMLSEQFKSSEIATIKIFAKEHANARGQYLFPYAFCLGNDLIIQINNRTQKNSAVLNLQWKERTDSVQIIALRSQYDSVKRLIVESQRYVYIEEQDNKLKCTTKFGLPIEIEFQDTLKEQNLSRILRGDLHIHTTWSDGKHSIEQMAVRAKELGREYIGITDHSYSLRIANGISVVDAKRQVEEIHQLNITGIKVLAGIEVEVLKDGSLDFPDAILSQFDYVIAGIHTFLHQPPQELLKRIEKALSNPYVNVFAHPSARLLGRPGVLFSDREPYGVKMSKIIEICKRNNVAIEFNAFPERFDVPTKYFDAIADSDVMLSIGTDSHSVAHLNCLEYAEIAVAASPNIKSKILNCLDAKNLLCFFEYQRAKKNVDIDVQENVTIHDFEHFFGNNHRIISGDDAVIGIDLTGSETKPSGWAVMRGNKVETAMICSDDEIIATSFKYNPKIISIDSPLSYPAGRCCTNENCECRKYGITRYCERLLFSFGIGVYPCLIPSMVNLTTRGIQLAKKFRDMGIEVIESYPGVAQDILNIRRKQNGLQHLKNSYKNFGLVGDFFTSESIKHDELDAIASALVGLFYINGQSVALGNDKENYLIVPSVAEKPQKPIVLGLAGGIGAGKTTLAEYLKFKYGFGYFRYSQIICKLYNCADDRKTLQELGIKIAQDTKRQKELSFAIVEEIKLAPNKNYVVDGLRHKLDYDILKEHFGDRFKLLYVDSSFINVYHRYNRKFNSVNMTEEEFQKIYYNESEMDLFMLQLTVKCSLIDNNKTYKDYFETFEKYFKEIPCQ
ncbi:MAG: PHP domain-containing protein [Bacteroidales bacterium]|jgi:histidinol phosphatase-like PHP family hydrolase/predicted nuclease with RNAse H fold/dephospho-CoA kinase|nr:PHP domain-containing protein [Bacteroidales bacterium]